VTLLKGKDFVLVVLLGLLKLVVPVLVEVLVLLDVGLLALLALLLVHEDKFFLGTVEFLILKFRNTVLGHLSFNVATLLLAGSSVLLHRRNELLNVFGVNLVVLTVVNSGSS
jgi:hypothetical protein